MHLKVSNLNVGIKFRKDELLLVQNFSYTFKDTGLYVLSGISGIGKSYLLGTLYGSYNSLSGEIDFNNKSIKDKKTYEEYIKNIFCLSAEGILIDRLTIKENFDVFDSNITNIDFDRFNSLNENVLDKFPYELSRGQKKIIEFLIAIYSTRKILFLDESLSEIDTNNIDICLKILEECKNKKLILLVSHEKEKANRIADVTLHLENKIIDIKENKEIKSNNIYYKINTSKKSKYLYKMLSGNKRFIFNDILIGIVTSIVFGFLSLIINMTLMENRITENEIKSNINGCLVIFLVLFILFFLIDIFLLFSFNRFRYKKERKNNYLFKQMNLSNVDKNMITSIQLGFSFIFVHVFYLLVSLPIFYLLPKAMNEELFSNFGHLGNEALAISISYLILILMYLVFYTLYRYIFITKRAIIVNEVN